MFLKNKAEWAMRKCMVAMATFNAILKNGGILTKSIISSLLLIIDYSTSYQIEAEINGYYPMVRDALSN